MLLMTTQKEMIPIANIVRYRYIENCVLNVYKNTKITYPVDIFAVLNNYPNIRVMSYQKFSQLNSCDICDVVALCKSESGCTHYERMHNRYLILYNDAQVEGRILWTLAHELGHIATKHLHSTTIHQIAENNLSELSNPILESEADFFAATLLSPFQVFSLLDITSVLDVQNRFGLSAQASIYRFNRYLKWKKFHVKTSFDNDILKFYSNK